MQDKEIDKKAQYWLLENNYSNLEMTDNKSHKKWKYISDIMVDFTKEVFEELEFYKQWLAFVCSAYESTAESLQKNNIDAYCENFNVVQGTMNHMFMLRMIDELDKKKLNELSNKHQKEIYNKMQDVHVKKLKQQNGKK